MTPKIEVGLTHDTLFVPQTVSLCGENAVFSEKVHLTEQFTSKIAQVL